MSRRKRLTSNGLLRYKLTMETAITLFQPPTTNMFSTMDILKDFEYANYICSFFSLTYKIGRD